MAKRKEFKPDKQSTGFLKRLHLTQKQRRTILKWVLYSAMLLLLSVLQDVIFCRIHIFGATTDLVPCGIFLICLLEGSEGGCVFTLIASTLYLFSGTAPGPYCIVFITVLAVFATAFRQGYLQSGFGAAMLCCSISVMVYEMLVFAIGLFLGLSRLDRAGVFALTGGLSVISLPILYPIVLSIGKIGGEAWKE